MASTDEPVNVPDGDDAATKQEVPAEGDKPSAEMTEEDIKGVIKIQATYRGHLVRKQAAAAAAAGDAGGEPVATAADNAAATEPDAAPTEPAAAATEPAAATPAEEAAESAAAAEPAADPADADEAAAEPAAAPVAAAPEDAAPADDEAAAAKAATTIQATFRGHQARKEMAASKKAPEADGAQPAAEAAAGAAAGEQPEAAAAEDAAADEQLEAAMAEDTPAGEHDEAAAAAAKQAAAAAAEAAEAVIVVCGPSGVGKGTLIGRLMQDYPQRFGFSVSHTTRGPRPGEQDGVHYHFRSKEEVLESVRAGLFLEHAEVHGNVYGTSIAAAQAVAQQGKLCVLDIDTQGAEQVKKSPYGPKALFLFVAPPSMEELERRLRGRGTETEDKIATRLKNATAEMAKSKEPGFFTAVITNNDLDTAYSDFKAAIRAHIPNSIPADAPAAKPKPAPATVAATAASAALQPAAADALPTPPSRTWASDDMRGLPVRQYMNEAVVPVLREALRALNKGRPEDPLQFVADYVLAERQKLIQGGQY